MPVPFHERVRHLLPNLTAENYRITSSASWQYNCIACVVGKTDSWWWPIPGRFWPAGVPREETLEAFISALGTQGFSPCLSPELELRVEKIALYSMGSIPTRAARQRLNGWWTSKLGPNFDIEHSDLAAVAGGIYGTPVVFLSRAITDH